MHFRNVNVHYHNVFGNLTLNEVLLCDSLMGDNPMVLEAAAFCFAGHSLLRSIKIELEMSPSGGRKVTHVYDPPPYRVYTCREPA